MGRGGEEVGGRGRNEKVGGEVEEREAGDGEVHGEVGEAMELVGRLKERGGEDVCGAEPGGGDVLYPRLFI